jgi:hypothetical protein
MMDAVMKSFLEDSFQRGQRLASDSGVLSLDFDRMSFPPEAYLLRFEGTYLRVEQTGIVEPTHGPLAAEVRFPPEYLRSTDPHLYLKICTLLHPAFLLGPHPDFFHPNVQPGSGAICLGNKFEPGTRLDALIHHLYEILTYQNFSSLEWDCLDPVAARFLREHPEVLSALQWKPLKRTSRRFSVSLGGAQHSC